MKLVSVCIIAGAPKWNCPYSGFTNQIGSIKFHTIFKDRINQISVISIFPPEGIALVILALNECAGVNRGNNVFFLLIKKIFQKVIFYFLYNILSLFEGFCISHYS